MTTVTARNNRFVLHNNEVLKDVKSRLKEVCENVYVARPTAVAKSLEEFIILSIPYSVRDKGPYQTTYLRIEVVVKNKVSGQPNLTKIESLCNNIIGLFPIVPKTKRFKADVPYLTVTGSDGSGYSIYNLQGKLIINTSDIY